MTYYPNPETTTHKGQANGYAGLDGSGALPSGQIPSAVELTANKGAASGYAGLNASSVVPTANLPAMAASGTGHASGLVPDPGSTSGTSKFLREDATWVVPKGSPIANGSSIGKTGVISGQTIYQPAADGLFLYTCYLVITTAGTSGNIESVISWGDSSNTATHNLTLTATDITASGNYGQASAVIQGVNDGIIYINTDFTGTAGSVVYNFYWSLTQLWP